jgi:cytosine/adenosine deaminase-related metal-dependent hydrolase
MQTRRRGPTGTTFTNAQLNLGALSTLRVLGSRIAAIGAAPQPGDAVIDLQGDRMLPGLINAHDHLQLNNMPGGESTQTYRDVQAWISEVHARRSSDPLFEASVAVEPAERLLIGGVKNLLSGVTTVAHHDPFHACLSGEEFPVHVLRDYGWSHSLYLDGAEGVRESYLRTPRDWPWMVHAAEGLDHAARQEFPQLDALGCLGANTLLVHGIALDSRQRTRLAQSGGGLIWCPASNVRLFGRTAEVRELAEQGRVALGTDSRLSGARDLLQELRLAGDIGGLDDATLERLVGADSARLLRLSDRGVLRPGARADILILPARASLRTATRAEVRLVLTDGVARYGDADYALSMDSTAGWTKMSVDGRPKLLNSRIATLLARAAAREPGLEWVEPTSRVA